jgi:HEPN domain-containing protein
MDRSADWLKQAQRDMELAETAKAQGYHEWCAFAAQQCGEKAVKALVQSLHGSVRGHAIGEILALLPAAVAVPDAVADAAGELDRLYFTSRDPNGFTSGSPANHFSDRSSQRFLDYARTVLEFCRSQIH